MANENIENSMCQLYFGTLCFWKKNIYDKDELEGSIGLRRKIFDGNCY